MQGTRLPLSRKTLLRAVDADIPTRMIILKTPPVRRLVTTAEQLEQEVVRIAWKASIPRKDPAVRDESNINKNKNKQNDIGNYVNNVLLLASAVRLGRFLRPCVARSMPVMAIYGATEECIGAKTRNISTWWVFDRMRNWRLHKAAFRAELIFVAGR